MTSVFRSTTSARPLAGASASTAWVLVANKPLYPFYVWWLVGADVAASLWTLAAWPLYLAVALAARTRPLGARVGLVLAGIADTAFAEAMYGASSGVEAFLVPCGALAALSFRAEEAWVSRLLTGAAFSAFVVSRFLSLPGLHPWPPAQAATLLALNLYSAASLTAFVGLRFASARG